MGRTLKKKFIEMLLYYVIIPGGITVYDQTDSSKAYGYLKSTTSGFDVYASRPTYNKGGFICTGELNRCNIPKSNITKSLLHNFMLAK